MKEKKQYSFLHLLLMIILAVCSTATMSAQTKVTSLSQLKVGSVIKIYPKDSNGTSNYGESNLALACSGDGKDLTSYEKAGSGDTWTIVDAGDGYFYLKNNLGCYWAYQGRTSYSSLTCTTSESSAVKVSLTWDSTYGGVCFWNQKDGTGLNNLYGYNYRYNWYSSKSNYNSSDANTTFDVALTDKNEINGIRYSLNLQDKTAMVQSNDYKGDIVIPQSVKYDGNNYAVTSLGNNCFARCGGLTSIILPNSITSLSDRCFNGCI